MAVYKRGDTYYYEFIFKGTGSARAPTKTIRTWPAT
jgi:hypothetical protein